MKIITQVSSVLLASSLFMSAIPKAQATPAVLAPVALCSTGVGCILVGTMAVGAITYYVWEYGGGKRVASDISGRVLKYLDDPEDDDVGVWEDPLDTRDARKADQICKARSKRLGASYEVIRDPATGKMICRFTGGNGR
jgi:hypothetical protein